MRLLATLTVLLVFLGLSAPAEGKIAAVRQPHNRPARMDSTTEDTKDEVRFHHMIYTIHWKQHKKAKHERQARRLKRQEAAAAQAAAEAAAAATTPTTSTTPTTPTTSSGSYSSSSSGSTISEAQAASYMAAAGFSESVIAWFNNGIISRESGYCPTAVYGHGCATVAYFYTGGPACSLFQLFPCPGPQVADPAVAARYAYARFQSQGYSAWGG